MKLRLMTLFICSFIVSGACSQEKNKSQGRYTGKEPTDPKATEQWEPVPPVVVPVYNNQPPSDAIVLFDGTSLDKWQTVDGSEAKWTLDEDGSMTVAKGTGDIQTKEHFGSVQLHIEWRTPAVVEGGDQHRGNSGVYFQDRYEVQVLDSYENKTYPNGQAGAIYKQHSPLVNACKKPGEWQTYDIIFHAPEFDEKGNKTKSGRLTVIHNGVLIQDHAEIYGTTVYIGWPKNEPHGPGPIKLQDHGHPVSYRNIWLRKL